MKIRVTDSEHVDRMEDTYELLAHAITEDLAKALPDFYGDRPISFNDKASIYAVIMERFKEGVEI